jgi:hypothetical protein
MVSLSLPVPDRLRGRLLAHTTAEHVEIAAATTDANPASGLVIRACDATTPRVLRRAARYRQPIVLDPGCWISRAATVDRPMAFVGEDGLFQMSLEGWAQGILAGGFDAVLTPSLFAPAGEEVLEAVVAAGNRAIDSRVITLVGTDAAMLDAENLPVLRRVLGQSSRPLAVLFAAKNHPMARRGRVHALRELLDALPGCMVLATEPIVGTDALVHGAGACAVGVTGGLRRPRRPGDPSGGSRATSGVPGLFLRQLWEHRSPGVYADWYANRPSPRCSQCGGRRLDAFDSSDQGKQAVLTHNIHAWLEVLDDIREQPVTERAPWLATDRARGLQTHVGLRPAHATSEADPVLRQLVALDGPSTQPALAPTRPGR